MGELGCGVACLQPADDVIADEFMMKISQQCLVNDMRWIWFNVKIREGCGHLFQPLRFNNENNERVHKEASSLLKTPSVILVVSICFCSLIPTLHRVTCSHQVMLTGLVVLTWGFWIYWFFQTRTDLIVMATCLKAHYFQV